MNWFSHRSIVTKSLLLFVLCTLAFTSLASEKEMRRIMVGLKLFPAIIAADYLLAEKKDNEGYLPLYILYQDEDRLSLEIAERLRQIKQIKNIPVKVDVLSFEEFIANKNHVMAAAFLAQAPNSYKTQILDIAVSSSILLFSPFRGDVESGIHSGLIVSDRILPYVNVKTLDQSGIRLKAFLLRASKQYD